MTEKLEIVGVFIAGLAAFSPASSLPLALRPAT
jgi:hypothetical protein